MMTRTTMFALMSAVCASIVPANSLKLKAVPDLADTRGKQQLWLNEEMKTAAYMDSPLRAAREIQRFDAANLLFNFDGPITPGSSVAASPPATPPMQIRSLSVSPPPLPSRAHSRAQSRPGSPPNIITQEALDALQSKGQRLSQQLYAENIAAREPVVSPTASIDTSIISVASSPSTSPLVRPQPVLRLPRSPFTFSEFSPGKRTISEGEFSDRWRSTSSTSPEKKLKTSGANDSSNWHS